MSNSPSSTAPRDPRDTSGTQLDRDDYRDFRVTIGPPDRGWPRTVVFSYCPQAERVRRLIRRINKAGF
jgi:hypothetical protein